MVGEVQRSSPALLTLTVPTTYSTGHITHVFVNNPLTNSLIIEKFEHNAFDVPTYFLDYKAYL